MYCIILYYDINPQNYYQTKIKILKNNFTHPLINLSKITKFISTKFICHLNYAKYPYITNVIITIKKSKATLHSFD